MWTHTPQYKPYVHILNNIALYKSLCWLMESYSAIWSICQHMKPYCQLLTHMSTYEIMLRNMNDMSAYETIKRIIKLYVNILNNTAYHMLPHEDILWIKNLYGDISINSAGIVFYVNTSFILRNMIAYVDKWPLNLTHHENGAIASHRNIRRLCW